MSTQTELKFTLNGWIKSIRYVLFNALVLVLVCLIKRRYFAAKSFNLQTAPKGKIGTSYRGREETKWQWPN